MLGLLVMGAQIRRGFSRWSATELEVRVGDCIWRRGVRGEDLHLANCFPGMCGFWVLEE